MDSTGGALHFDADVDNRKYLAKVIAMENRYAQFAQKIIRENASMTASFHNVTRSMGGFDTSVRGAEQRLTSFYNASARGNTEMIRQLNEVNRQMNNIDAPGSGGGGRIKKNQTDVIGLVGSYVSAGAALKYLFDQTLAFERIKSPLTFILGSEGAANNKLEELRDIANELGLEFFTLASSYKSFTAAARASNFDLAQSEKIFKSVTKASAVLKLSTPQLEGALLAIQQMISKGNVQAEELRGQLAERLPGAFALAAKAMGVTEKELNKLLETGQVLAADLLPKLADQLDKSYGDKATEGITGLNAELNKFYSSLQSLAGEGSFLADNIFSHIVRGARLVSEELRQMTRGTFMENVKYLFTFDPADQKTQQKIYDLRDSFKNSQSIIDSSQKTDLSGKNLAELRNYFHEIDEATKLAMKSYNTYLKGVSKGELTEGGDKTLKDFKDKFEGLQIVRQEVGLYLKKARDESVKVDKTIKDGALTSVDAIRKRIAELQKLPTSAVKGSDIYKRIDSLQAMLKDPKKVNDTFLKEQESLQKKIDEQIKESSRKTKNADEEQIQAVKDKYSKLLSEIDKFYKNPKNNGKYTVKSDGLKAAMNGEIDSLKYEQDTKKILEQLQIQEGLFAKFEDYKTNVSEDAANKRLKDELANYNTFAEYLNSYIQPLMDKVMGGQYLNADEQTRLDNLNKIYQKFNQNQKDQQNKAYADALLISQSLEEKIAAIKLKYANTAKALGKDATNSRKESLLKERDDEINNAIFEANQKTVIYQNLNKEILSYTRARAKDEIAIIENLIATAKDLDPTVKAQLEEQLKYAKEVLAVGTNKAYVNALNQQKEAIEKRLATEKLSTQEIEEYKRQLLEIKGLLKDTSGFAGKVGKVGEAMGQIGGAISELGASLESTNPELAYTLGTLGDLAAVGQDVAGAFTSFASGDIVGGITKTIGAVAKLFSIGSRVKEMNKKAREEVQKFYDDAAAGEREYQALLRDRERKLIELNAIGLSGINNQTKALKAQKQQIDKDYADTLAQIQAMNEGQITSVDYKHGTWLRKAQTNYTYAGLGGMNYDQLEQLYIQGKLADGAKELFDQLKKLKEEGADVEQALLDAAVAAKELATGTTAQSLTSNIIANLRAGKKGISNVMDEYTQIIQDALISGFESEVVAVEMRAFYERLSALALSDGELSKDEIEQAKQDYIKTRKSIDDKFNALEQITGTQLGSADGAKNQSGITASIKSLTEDTGVALEGLLRGIYDIIKRGAAVTDQNTVNLGKQLDLMVRSVGYQMEIRDNTAQIVLNTAQQILKMDSMITKLHIVALNTIPAGKTARDLGL